MSDNLPGIVGLMVANPRAAVLLNALAEGLLRTSEENPTFTNGERELVFAVASFLNGCEFCCNSHSACAVQLLDADTVNGTLSRGPDYLERTGNKKLASIIRLAWTVAVNHGQDLYISMQPEIVDAKANGWTDADIHDATLIAASACMFNRYVDSLTPSPGLSKEEYLGMGKVLAEVGYVNAIAHMSAQNVG